MSPVRHDRTPPALQHAGWQRTGRERGAWRGSAWQRTDWRRGGRSTPRAAARGAVLLWPLPAFLAWGCGWALLLLLLRAGWSVAAAAGAALVLVLLMALLGDSPWRRRFIAWGFPLSVAVAVWSAGDAGLAQLSAGEGNVGGSALVVADGRCRFGPGLPGASLAGRALVPHAPWRAAGAASPRPLGAWRHSGRLGARCRLWHWRRSAGAPRGLPRGHAARLGVELALGAVVPLALPFAKVAQGDFWREDWTPYALVYLFARPESMARAAAKAATELRAGAWLVSLDFEATEWQAQHQLHTDNGQALWLYQAPLVRKDAAPAEQP